MSLLRNTALTLTGLMILLALACATHQAIETRADAEAKATCRHLNNSESF